MQGHLAGQRAGEQLPLGFPHFGNRAADHPLDGLFPAIEGAFDGLDLQQVWLVCLDPAINAFVELLQALDDHAARSVAVKGKDQGAVAAQGDTEPSRGFYRQKAAVEQMPIKTAHHGPIGRDHHGFLAQTDLGDQRHGIRLAAAGRDDNFNTGGFRRT